MTPRLVLITRRFWPLTDDVATRVGRLAVELRKRGCQITVLTARWHVSWPEELDFQGIRVIRLHNPALPYWGTWRYMAALGQWLQDHLSEIDLVYVAGLRHDAYVAVDQCQAAAVPVVLAAEGAGATGDITWQQSARFSHRIVETCRQADRLIVPFDCVGQELFKANYPADRVCKISPGVPIPELAVDDLARATARAALASASPQLEFEPTASLTVCVGRWEETQNLDRLLQAWRTVASRLPGAQLWLVGDGPQEMHLDGLIKQLDLADSVTIAGAFDHIGDVLAAANLVIAPSLEGGASQSLLEAMAAGLPILASDTPGRRELISPEIVETLVAAEEETAWAAAIVSSLAGGGELCHLSVAREQVAAHFSLTDHVDRHLEIFAPLCDR